MADSYNEGNTCKKEISLISNYTCGIKKDMLSRVVRTMTAKGRESGEKKSPSQDFVTKDAWTLAGFETQLMKVTIKTKKEG